MWHAFDIGASRPEKGTGRESKPVPHGRVEAGRDRIKGTGRMDHRARDGGNRDIDRGETVAGEFRGGVLPGRARGFGVGRGDAGGFVIYVKK